MYALQQCNHAAGVVLSGALIKLHVANELSAHRLE
jgi:hypothetical protein